MSIERFATIHMEASILSQTHQGTINKNAFLAFFSKQLPIFFITRGGKSNFNLDIFYQIRTRPKPRFDYRLQTHCVTSVFWPKTEVTQLTSVKTNISWFGSSAILSKNFRVQIIFFNLWHNVEPSFFRKEPKTSFLCFLKLFDTK